MTGCALDRPTLSHPPGIARSLLASLALVSATAIAYEILLLRLLSIVQWHHFAYMIISVALLGYGASGTFIALYSARLQRNLSAAFAVSATLFALSMPICFFIAQRLPFNGLELIWDPYQLVYLGGLYLLFFIPFFFAAVCIGAVLASFPLIANRVYLFDLVGAGVGALGIAAALFAVAPQNALKLLVACALVAAALASIAGGRKMPSLILALAATGMLVIPQAGIHLHPSPYKDLSQALAVIDAKTLGDYATPLGQVTLVDNPTVPFRYAPGLSFTAARGPPPQLALFVDGDAAGAITRFDGRTQTLAYLGATPEALAYHLVDRPRVLVLGAGGGREVLRARYFGAERIDAVEINPAVVNLVSGTHANFAGHLYASDEVRVHIGEARAHVERSDSDYEIIQLSLLDSAATSGAGAHALRASYVYTVEALASYVTRLAPGGLLSITRWTKLPPRDSLKLFATAVESLRRADVSDPPTRLAMIRSWNTATVLIKNGPFSPTDLATIRDFCRHRSFDLVYYHGMPRAEANRFNVLAEPFFHDAAVRLVEKDPTLFEQYKFNVQPATDDRPYFYHFFKWSALPELLAKRTRGAAGLVEWGYLLLIATLIQAIAAGALLILLPLWRKAPMPPAGSRSRPVAYFFALGLAFLFIEIAFIQKLILFLGNPVYAVAVVLSGFLIFAGLGSGFSARFTRAERTRPDPIVAAVAAIAIITLVYVLVLLRFLPLAVGAAEPLKVLLALLLIAPLAFCMGMPFPLGLRRLARNAPEFVPWAWGINGFASVLSAALATLIAVRFGFSALILLGAALYLSAVYVLPARGLTPSAPAGPTT